MKGLKKRKLLPIMAYRGIRQNAIIYYPYFAACIFSVFTYFIFSSLLHNDLMERLPKAAYAWMMLDIGKVLLSVILFLFLIYAGSFLQKRRQKERGLYSLLGLERKHIGIMVLWENIGIYIFCTLFGTGIGFVFAKLMFLILLKLSRLNVQTEFVFSFDALLETFEYFAIVFLCIFIKTLWGLYRAKPVELLAGSRKGEKEPKHIWLWTLAGAAMLGQGYQISITSRMNSMIFTNFFLAVFLVVLATYLLFTSGSVALLKWLKKRKRFYYRPANQVTVSGMLYRMKKNAAGLSNICIFSTMLIITLTCTFAMWLGMEDIAYFVYPYDVAAQYSENSDAVGKAEDKAAQLTEKYGQNVARIDCYDSIKLSCAKETDSNYFDTTEGYRYEDWYGVTLLVLEDYNRLEGQNETLENGEVLLYSTGEEFPFDTVDFLGVTARVKGRPENIYPYPREKNGMFSFTSEYVMVVKDWEQRNEFVTAWAKKNGVTDLDAFLHSGTRQVCLLLDCKEEEKEPFVKEWMEWCQQQMSFLRIENGLEGRDNERSMNGGLLFIGVVFGTIFFICLLLIMYFKQVSEGYEDQGSFAVMQKVGMSDGEIRSTIRRQISLVFFLPFMGAILHTSAGMFMTNCLLAALRFFDTALLIRCCVGVTAGFVLIYAISYLFTARTYYRIVRFEDRTL